MIFTYLCKNGRGLSVFSSFLYFRYIFALFIIFNLVFQSDICYNDIREYMGDYRLSVDTKLILCIIYIITLGGYYEQSKKSVC